MSQTIRDHGLTVLVIYENMNFLTDDDRKSTHMRYHPRSFLGYIKTRFFVFGSHVRHESTGDGGALINEDKQHNVNEDFDGDDLRGSPTVCDKACDI